MAKPHQIQPPRRPSGVRTPEVLTVLSMLLCLALGINWDKLLFDTALPGWELEHTYWEYGYH